MRDEVDQTGHSVRAVQCRRRAAHDFDALEQFEREVFAVKGGGAEGVAARHAYAIRHQQHPVATQTPDIDAHVAVTPGACRGAADRETGRRAFDRSIGKILQGLTKGAALLVAQGAGVDHVVRQRKIVRCLLLARAADHHFAQCCCCTDGVGMGLCVGGAHAQADKRQEGSQGAQRWDFGLAAEI